MINAEEEMTKVESSGEFRTEADSKLSRMSDYFCLIKPEVTFLVLIATGLGCYMAAPRGSESLDSFPCGSWNRFGRRRYRHLKPLY